MRTERVKHLTNRNRSVDTEHEEQRTLTSKIKLKIIQSYEVEPLSGDPKVRLLKLDVKLYGLGEDGTGWFSSTGKQVSTIASKQLTNNSDDSTTILYC